MAGNELKVCKFLLKNIGNLDLNHLGMINEIATPMKQSSDLKIIDSENDLVFVSTQDSKKKADIYLNKQGISIKQTGGIGDKLRKKQISQLLHIVLSRSLKHYT